ncbi:MAG: pantoate--beta-alanine ligase [Bacteriovoracaceae bacterium]|nr:pantoate--beta-alanine ligase [Bacteroidota bacterium]
MITFSQIPEIRLQLKAERNARHLVGFVPTMGFLHEGHLSLIKKAKQENDIVVLSIFVNPTQFAPSEDLDRYPRDLQHDALLAQQAGCDIVFVPPVDEMYPSGFLSYVTVNELSTVLEGEFRPTHFKGVTTVVLKLLNIVQPDVAYFGQKDVQQSIILKKMIADLNLPVRIDVVPTIREADGLAMSSRNVYLDPGQRKNATVLHRSLLLAETNIALGEHDPKKIVDAMTAMILEHNPTQIDYVKIVDAQNLQEKHILQSGDTIVLPLAVRFGATRLIDNIILTVK